MTALHHPYRAGFDIYPLLVCFVSFGTTLNAQLLSFVGG